MDVSASAQRSPRVYGEWTRRLLLVVVSAGLTLGVLELTLRVGAERYRCNDRLGWTYRPGARVLVFNRAREFVHFVRFNRSGMRDREHPLAPEARAFRMVLLGDSFAAGLQVSADETFARLLEVELQADAKEGQTIEVWNAAVDGFGTAQALNLFEDRIAPYEPSVVFLGLFLMNDLSDNVFEAGGYNHHLALRCGRPYYELDRDGGLTERQAGASMRQQHGSQVGGLLRRSRLYASLFPVPDQSGASFADWDVLTGRNPDDVAAAWRLTRALVSELDRRARMNGGRLVLLLMPSVEEASFSPDSTTDGLGDEGRFERAHALAEAFVRESGIPYVDLYPALRQSTRSGAQPYFQRDMHWNARGHAVVAAAIRSWLAGRCADFDVPLRTCVR